MYDTGVVVGAAFEDDGVDGVSEGVRELQGELGAEAFEGNHL